jgi:uncharacterized membrane protein YkoI
MLPTSATTRRALGIGIALTVGTGVGLGAYTLGNAAGTDTLYFPRAAAATTSASPSPGTTTAGPTSAGASTSSPLTLDQATAVAVQAAAPGRVVKWDEDHEATGLRYDLTLLHDDGSTTDVEVDTVSGQVTSIDHDTDGD